MAKKVTASQLRQDIYRIIDSVVETGDPVEIQRGDNILQIVRVERNVKKLDRLKKRKVSNEDPEYFVHIDWSSEWKK